MAGLFVATGHDGLRIFSEDGRTWHVGQTGKEGETFGSVAYGGGRFVAVGRYGYDPLWTSSADGRTWQTTKGPGRDNRHMLGVGFGLNQFICVGGQAEVLIDNAADVFTSPDGLAWEGPHQIGGKTVLRRIAFGNGRFVGVGDRGRTSASTNGRDWQTPPKQRAVDTMIEVAFGAGRFVGVGLHGLRMSSEDGLEWGHRQTGEEGEHLNSVLWTGERFVAVGAGVTFFSKDGITWTQQANNNAPLIAAFGNGIFVGAHWRGRLLYSTDAVNWEQVHRAEHHAEAICFGAMA